MASGSSTQTLETGPWSPMEPYLLDAAALGASNYYGTTGHTPQPYTPQSYTPAPAPVMPSLGGGDQGVGALPAPTAPQPYTPQAGAPQAYGQQPTYTSQPLVSNPAHQQDESLFVPNPYTGEINAAIPDQFLAGGDMIAATAAGGTPYVDAAGQYTMDVMQGPVYADGFMDATGAAMGYSPTAGFTRETGAAMNYSSAPGFTATTNAAMAPGGYVNAPGYGTTMNYANDPYYGRSATTDEFLTGLMDMDYQSDALAQVQENALADAVSSSTAMFAGSGMTNSGMAMDTTARAATEAVAPYEYMAYNDAMNRGLTAAGMQDAAWNAGGNRSLGAANSANSLYLSSMDDALQAAGMQESANQFGANLGLQAAGMQEGANQYGMNVGLQGAGMRQDASQFGQSLGMQAAGMAPTLESASYIPGSMMTGYGSQLYGYEQGMLDREREQFYRDEDNAREGYNNYLNSILALSGQGGMEQQPVNQPSFGQQVAGAATGGLGLYGATLATPLAPYAAPIAGATALMGLF